MFIFIITCVLTKLCKCYFLQASMTLVWNWFDYLQMMMILVWITVSLHFKENTELVHFKGQGPKLFTSVACRYQSQFCFTILKTTSSKTPDKCDPDLSFDVVTELQQGSCFSKIGAWTVQTIYLHHAGWQTDLLLTWCLLWYWTKQ